MSKKYSSGTLIAAGCVIGGLTGCVISAAAVSTKKGKKTDKEMKHFYKKLKKYHRY